MAISGGTRKSRKCRDPKAARHDHVPAASLSIRMRSSRTGAGVAAGR